MMRHKSPTQQKCAGEFDARPRDVTASRETDLRHCSPGSALSDQSCAALLLARTKEENGAVNAPNGSYAERQQGFRLGADPHERQDDISQHTAQIRHYSENG